MATGPTIGYVPGVFDLFHVGHLNVLRQARAQCDVLVAGLVSDELCETVKGIRPFVPLAERLEIVDSLAMVDATYAETSLDRREAWHQVGFHRVFKGDDWRGSPRGVDLERLMSLLGVEVVYFPYTVHTSSTQLRAVIAARSAS
ncbi:adenylyltransferase/cytidyltransferase family protein [Nocardioides rubriscoriae]|uniref:adenylyltransferase/cytidyltransferase family protein n=1 Tax=Nocardioides rubriscoriae TaxID=642762 RepID=UPI0011DF6582|nr:adenylyltransferase/cytidyltransferase family protein [Nocardioides rubriscoriae]